MSMKHALDELDDVLGREREALLKADMDGLAAAGARKIELLQSLSRFSTELATATDRLQQLSEANLANGSLLARRRMDLAWMLRQLGASSRETAYDAQGVIAERAITRLQAEA
ncbi:MAG: flagellar protein FlgN [Xanthomonadales bacterium]|jgi:flagellar biosynthesis/type III secretory pathway chaperone|nr:flagellar protein FlgN [Xanthomonadales bacterium]HRD71397.1 flagellar protein FlgN [Aquimonas sp.]